jgi:threonine/homoserine/homoserine lactone efflux protein
VIRCGWETAAVVSTAQLLGFGVAALVIIAIPGPSVVFVVARALSYGRAVALLSVLGNTAGLGVAMVLVALGLGTVVADSVLVFTVVKLAGAAYLVWLGVQALRHRSGVRLGEVVRRAPPAGLVAARQGFVVGVANPKAFVMFAAVLPQFVDRSTGAVPLQMLVLGTLAVVLGLVCDTCWALLASRLRSWFDASPRRGRAIGTAGGCSMVGLGVGLALTSHPA